MYCVTFLQCKESEHPAVLFKKCERVTVVHFRLPCGVRRLTSSGATGRTSVLSKTSISSPSALAATAGEEFTGAPRVPPVILGLLFSIHPAESSDSVLRDDSTYCHSSQSHLASPICVSDDRRWESRASRSFTHPLKSDPRWFLEQAG